MPETKRPTNRAGRKAKVAATLPSKFQPKFWVDADNRQSVIKAVRHRVGELQTDTGADSVQKRLLVERAVFVAISLETQEIEAMEGKEFDQGKYTQQVNCLIGLLKALGLQSRAEDVLDLRKYVKGKQ